MIDSLEKRYAVHLKKIENIERTAQKKNTDLLSLKEAANYLKVSESFLYHNQHKIPPIKFNRNLKYLKSKLDEFLNRGVQL